MTENPTESATAATGAKKDPRRQQLLAKIHIAKKQLGLDEPTYRAIVARHGKGRESAGALAVGQLINLIEELKAKGWKDKAPAGARRAVSGKAHVRKVFAMWGEAGRKGVVRDPTPGALRAFVARMTGVSDPEWLSPAQATLVVEALKAWLAREGAA